MTRARRLALILASLALGGASCGGDECIPRDFDHGSACDDDGHTVLSCFFDKCGGGLFCSDTWVINESACPSHLPRCVGVSPGKVVCAGEVIGSCSAAGFAGCEDTFTQLTCADDGSGVLRLMRGPCMPGARCVSLPPGSVGPGCEPSL